MSRAERVRTASEHNTRRPELFLGSQRNGRSVADGIVRGRILNFWVQDNPTCRSAEARVPDVHSAIDHGDFQTTTATGHHRLASVIRLVVVSLFR
jgi:hypothetical protein